MRLLFVVTLGGGVDTSLRTLSRGLIQRGHEVSFLYIRNSQDARPAAPLENGHVYEAKIGNLHYYFSKIMGMRIFSKPVRSLEELAAFSRKLSEIIKFQKPDLIEMPEMFVLPQCLQHIPYIVRLHSAEWTWRKMLGEKERLSDKIEKLWESNTLKSAAGISSPSRFLKQKVSQGCSYYGNIEDIPYAVDTDLFKPGIKSDLPLILFVGRIEKRKGADILMQAIPQILKKYPKCRFVFAGRICDDIKEEMRKVMHQVEFLGIVPHEELVGWYQKASIFVAPSVWDHSPNTIYEAMACGVAVIASRVGGIPEIVEDGITGLLVSPGSSLDLAEKILWLLNHPAEQKQMGHNARERATTHYNIDKIADQTLSFYEETLGVVNERH